MADVSPRRKATSAVAVIRDAEAALATLTEGLDARVALAPDVARERVRLEQVLADRIADAAALIPQFEPQLAAAEPEHRQRIQAARAATAAAFEAWQAASEAEVRAQALGNSVVDGLTNAIGTLRSALAEKS